jgi:hypothetical protein
VFAREYRKGILYTVGMSVDWHRHFGSVCGGSLKIKKVDLPNDPYTIVWKLIQKN